MNTLQRLLTLAGAAALVITLPARAFQAYPAQILTPPTPIAFGNFGLSVDVSPTHVVASGLNYIQPGGGTSSAWVFERNLGQFVNPFELVTSDQLVGAKYASSVGIDGDFAAIGCMRDSTADLYAGSVYLFERQPDGTWLELQKVFASDANALAEFGQSLAIEGNRLVVGAPSAKAQSAGGSIVTCGATYVFERQLDGTWIETAKLVPTDTPSGNEFGFSVDLSGDRVVGGAHLDDDNGQSAGAAYVFERDGSGAWLQAQKLLASDGDTNDYWGYDVAISGATVACGAWRDIDVVGVNGSVTIFERQIGGTYLETAKLDAQDDKSIRFGQALDLDGDTLVVGAFLSNPLPLFESGLLHRFRRTGASTWTQTGTIRPFDPKSDDMLGLGVAIEGHWIVAGQKDDDAGATDSGSVFVAYNYDEGSSTAPIAQGTGTPGCAGVQTMDLLGPALIGNANFGVVCDNTPTTGLGFLGLGGQPDLVGHDWAGVGALIHLDLPNSPGLIAVPFPSDPSGTSELAFTLPNTPALIGVQLHAQSVWRWTGTCSLPPFDYSSSRLLSFVVTAD